MVQALRLHLLRCSRLKQEQHEHCGNLPRHHQHQENRRSHERVVIPSLEDGFIVPSQQDKD